MNLFLTADAAGGSASMLIMIVLMFAVFYFFMIRPENKKKKQVEQMDRVRIQVKKWGISTTAKMEAAEAEARASKGRKKA